MNMNVSFEDLERAGSELRLGYLFDAIRIVFGNKTADFLQLSIYRKILIFAWRLRVKWYLYACCISTYKQNTTSYFAKIVKEVMLKSGLKKQLKKIKRGGPPKPKKHYTPTEAYTGPFPMEIWFEIQKLTPSVTGNLIRVNKTFCDAFAPILYEELNLHLAVSSTKKLLLNDANFLKYGPDFLEDWKTIDLDNIYKRHQESKKYEFEFLDLFKKHTSWIDDDEEVYGGIISNNYLVLFLFQGIISNPKSYLKRYIKDLSITVQVLLGSRELLDTSNSSKNSIYDYLLDHVSNNKDLFYVQSSSCPYYASSIQDRFRQDRWIGPGSVLREPTQYRDNRQYYHTGREFPTRVYNKELLAPAIVLNYLYTGDSRRKLREVETKEEFRVLDPFYHYKLHLQEEHGDEPFEENEPHAFLDYIDQATKETGLIQVRDVEIERRQFFSTSEATCLIKKIIKVMTSTETSSMNTSFMLVSQKMKDQIEENHDGDDRHEFNTNYMIYHEPFTFLINKPNNAGMIKRREKRRKRLVKKHTKQSKRNKKKRH